MDGGGLAWTADLSLGEWIAPRLGSFGQVTSVVPRGFPAYARVLHPVGEPDEGPDDDWFVAQSPNLFWPADRSWCVATEIDVDSTVVAGSTALVEAVLARGDLEAWPVQPADLLSIDGDAVNV